MANIEALKPTCPSCGANAHILNFGTKLKCDFCGCESLIKLPPEYMKLEKAERFISKGLFKDAEELVDEFIADVDNTNGKAFFLKTLIYFKARTEEDLLPKLFYPRDETEMLPLFNIMKNKNFVKALALTFDEDNAHLSELGNKSRELNLKQCLINVRVAAAPSETLMAVSDLFDIKNLRYFNRGVLEAIDNFIVSYIDSDGTQKVETFDACTFPRFGTAINKK